MEQVPGSHVDQGTAGSVCPCHQGQGHTKAKAKGGKSPRSLPSGLCGKPGKTSCMQPSGVYTPSWEHGCWEGGQVWAWQGVSVLALQPSRKVTPGKFPEPLWNCFDKFKTGLLIPTFQPCENWRFVFKTHSIVPWLWLHTCLPMFRDRETKDIKQEAKVILVVTRRKNSGILMSYHFLSSVQSLMSVWLFATTWTAACQASLSITNSQSLFKFMSIESVMPSNHVILCHPLLLPASIFPSIRVFSNESGLRIRWPKYWSFSFSISPSKEYSGLISFRMDLLDLLAVQGTLKSLLQHFSNSSKALILWHAAFFIVQLSHPYMTPGKTIALTRWTIVGKVMSLLFRMLSRLVITFLPRNKSLLISWLQHHLQWFWSPRK